MSKCIYKYKNQVFNSEAELDDFLIEKFGYESKFGDLVFNKKTNFLRTKNIIENKIMKDAADLELQMKIRNAKKRAAYYDEEEVLDFDPPYIGVNKFLTKIRKPDGSRLNPEFIVENYWSNRKDSWQNPLQAGEDIASRFSEDEIEIFFKSKDNLHLLSDKEAK
jgi:hypothetical protein